jgi:hypothetical protein
MIHHGGMQNRGKRVPSLPLPTMMNHGVISNPVISEISLFIPMIFSLDFVRTCHQLNTEELLTQVERHYTLANHKGGYGL